MACLTTEKTSPMTQQKRCSLPGPMGTLNLYAAHQQRRLSERGLMIYRPNKPDIDLIRDFTNSGRRGSTSFCGDATGHHLHHYPHASHRRHSTVNIGPGTSSSSAGPSSSLDASSISGRPLGSANYTTERRHSSIIPGASPYFLASNSSGICPGSISPTTTSNTSSTFHFTTNQSSSRQQTSTSGNHVTLSGLPGGSTSFGGAQPSTSSSTGCCEIGTNPGPSSLNSASTSSLGGGCRKVRLRIKKNPGTKEKVFELTPIMGSGSLTSSPGDEEDRLEFLNHPHFDTRRYSDSAAVRKPPHICITPDRPLNRGKKGGIVCSTGDLLTLKCLTSSAQEIRCIMNPQDSSNTCTTTSGSATQDPPLSPSQILGNRSRSFDATIIMARKGPGSSWFSRRHQPIAAKLPVPIDSPTISSGAETSYFPSNATSSSIFRTPILTITNENASNSELIEIPSPPAASPASSRDSPEEKTKVAWDRNGFVLDAAVLGIAIENHLRKVDMRRRATFSALYQPPPTLLEPKGCSRARSASACVIQIPTSIQSGDSMNKSTTSSNQPGRKSSLTTGSKLFFWDKAPPTPPDGGPGSSKTGATNNNPVATTSVSFTNPNSAGGHPTFETHLHHIPHGISSAFYTPAESPTTTGSENFINFRTTEDDIQEEEGNVGSDDDENEYDDDDAQESQAFLRTIKNQSFTRSAGNSVRFKNPPAVTSQVAPSSSSRPSSSSFSNNNANQNTAINNSTPTGTNSNRANGISICSAIRDFILHSIRP